jgi:hypothetical protein
MIGSGRMKWAGCVARMGSVRNEILKERERLENLGLHDKVLKWIYLSIETNGGLF